MPFSDFLLRNNLRAMGVNPESGAGGPSTPGGPSANPGVYEQLFGSGRAQKGMLFNPQQQRLFALGTTLLNNSYGQVPQQGSGMGMSNAGISPGLLSLFLNQR